MHARSALFDAYGDHLRTRGNHAPVAALVRMLAAVGIAAPAVRTAISRMVIQGWLEPIQLPTARGYRATRQATVRLDEAASRIYRTREEHWDGSWQLLLVDPVPARSRRTRLHAGLTWLGYAQLAESVWISPRASGELDDLLAREDARATSASLRDFNPMDRPLHAWDLATLGREYAAWLASAKQEVPVPVLGDGVGGDPDQAAFAARFHLVHEWRKFLFRDPGLPGELLPDDWPGRTAAAFFDAESARLKPGADRFVDRCLSSQIEHSLLLERNTR